MVFECGAGAVFGVAVAVSVGDVVEAVSDLGVGVLGFFGE